MKDIRQSNAYAEYLARTGWNVRTINDQYVYIKKIPILGSVIKLQRTSNLQLPVLESIAMEERAYQIIVEPSDQESAEILKAKKYIKGKSPYLVTKTIQIDLAQRSEEIYKKMKKRTRRDIKKTSHINTYEIDKIEKFYDSWQMSIGYTKTIPPIEQIHALKHSFKNDCAILITPNASSGAIFLYTDEVGYYWYAFSNKQGRIEKAQYKILWAGINWAKHKGAKMFDMEGIYDKRYPVKNWRGFSKFKQGFGGVEIEFPGVFIKRRMPL